VCSQYDPMVKDLVFECWFCEETTKLCMNFSSPFYHGECPTKGKNPKENTSVEAG
jgi:hypothetical protein